MKLKSIILSVAAMFLSAVLFPSNAQDMPKIPEMPDIEGYDFEKDPERFKAVATGGVPMGRWKEGLLFEGIEPMPWLASAANWFPGAEEVRIPANLITSSGQRDHRFR